jgi:hypothetical protein
VVGWGSVHYPSTGRQCLPRRLGGVRAPNERALGLQGAKVSVERRARFLDLLHPRGGVLDGGFSLIICFLGGVVLRGRFLHASDLLGELRLELLGKLPYGSGFGSLKFGALRV